MSERKRSSVDEEAARSTDRPPAPADELERDLAAAIKTAKNSSPGRYGPPAATAKIRPFELAQALAMSSADADPASAGANKPLREDDAPFVPPEVEVLGEEEITSGIPSSAAPSSAPPSTAAVVVQKAAERTRDVVGATTLASEPEPAPLRVATPPRSYTGLVILALIVGLGVTAYVYVYANR